MSKREKIQAELQNKKSQFEKTGYMLSEVERHAAKIEIKKLENLCYWLSR
jgi:Skp family chaperone for outer membrane proteins